MEITILRSVPLRLIKMFQQSSNQHHELQTLDWDYTAAVMTMGHICDGIAETF